MWDLVLVCNQYKEPLEFQSMVFIVIFVIPKFTATEDSAPFKEWAMNVEVAMPTASPREFTTLHGFILTLSYLLCRELCRPHRSWSYHWT